MRVSQQLRAIWVAAGIAMIMPATMIGEQKDSDAAKAAELAQSYQIQADIAAIEQDKASAGRDLLNQWQSVLDPGVYDLYDELGDIVAKAPAWQIYGASKAPDFQTMLSVLTGRIPAGSLINGSDLVGETNNALTYTPIAPCRIIDTRNTGAGIIPANGTRSFHLEADGLATQGGAGACPGLPNFSHKGWAVNITVVGQAGNGWLTVFPFSGAEPSSSTVNFSTGQWSIANGVNVTGCYACAGGDITVHAYFSATHVIVDVVGFYHQTIGARNTVSRIAGTGTSIGAGARGYADGGECPAGTVLIGGDVAHPGQDVAIGESRLEAATNHWTAWMINNDGIARTVTVTSLCQDAPVALP
jgi:hypothetical protein